MGAPVDRVDGFAKVTGSAKYAAEHAADNLAYAVAVQSTIARGRIKALDARAALASDGVLDVITWENAARLHAVESNPETRPGQTHLVLQDDRVRYYGQYIAMVIAETLEQAQYGASRLEIEYDEEPANSDLMKALDQAFQPKKVTTIDAPPVDSTRGDVPAGLREAALRLDLTFTTPIQNHNAMEPHATVAQWNGEDLLLMDSTQWVLGTRNMVATHLGLSPDRIRLVSPFVGGGFGSKGNPWPHPTLAAMAARHVKRPVKLVLAREQMFSQVGHRPATVQHLQLGAEADGRLTAISNDVVSGTSQFDNYVEAAGATARVAYSCANVKTTHRLARLDVNTPCPMRAPGEGPGNWALECAMDELAYACGLDPLEMRLRNYAERDEDRGKPFSSKSLRACYAEAAERFGWERRPCTPRVLREGHWQIGWGMASAIFTVKLSGATARVRLERDGTAVVSTASHDIGTGAYTALAQVAAAELQMPVSRVRVELGDTDLPKAPASAGSQTSGSVGSAIVLAAREAVRRLTERASTTEGTALFGIPASRIHLRGEVLECFDQPERRVCWVDLLAQAARGLDVIEAEGTWTPQKMEERPWSGYSFGAHCCEVAVDEDLGQVRVRRWVGAFAAGRILNEKTARSQLMGGIVWGIGQALTEQTIYDPSNRIVNRNLADYLVPVNADVPAMDIALIPEVDTQVNPAGAKGLGELGICGAAAAVTNAVFHATGVRCRALPIVAAVL